MTPSSRRREPWFPSNIPFVGRDVELRVLRAGLERAQSGRGSVILISGEPGIGKTRLLEVFADEARATNTRVLWGRCYEWDGAPAYWPWIQVLRAYIEGVDDDRLSAELGSGAVHVAQLLPELHQRLDIPRLEPAEPAQARFLLFEALTNFVVSAAARQPLVLLLEDVHWADAPSLLLLQFITQSVRDAPVLLAGTYRDIEIGPQHPLSTTLLDLTRELYTERLALKGLSPSEVRVFIEHLSGSQASESLVDALHVEAEGNPFFVGEITRLLVSEGRLDAPLQTPLRDIPASVRGVIDRRLNRFSSECNQVLTVAAVIGRVFSLPLLQQVSGRSTDELMAKLNEAVEGRLVEPDSVGRYRFTHALVQDTLYERLSLTQRAQLHREIGEALECLDGPLVPTLVTITDSTQAASRESILAYHFAAAAPLGFAQKAFDYALQAAERAMDQAAWETAAGQYQQALRALDLVDEPDVERYCQTLLLLGEAQNRAVTGRSTLMMTLGAGGSPDARESFHRAATLARDAGMAEILARAALGLSGFNPYAHQGGVEGVQLMEDALSLLPDEPSALRARLLARVSMDQYMLIEMGKLPFRRLLEERIRERSAQAVAMARTLDDPATLGYALLMLGMQGEFHMPEARLPIADEVIDLAGVCDDRTLLVWGLQLKAMLLERLGEVGEARTLLDQMEMVVDEVRVPYFIWRIRIHHAAIALRSGDFSGVERWLNLAANIQPHSGVAVKMLISLRREQERTDDLLPLVERMDASIPDALSVRAFRVLCALESGDAAAGRTAFAMTCAEEFNNPVTPLRALTLLAESCVILQDVERAELLYDRLLPHASQNVVCSSTDYTGGAVNYYLGLLATLLDRWRAAGQHFEYAVRMNDRWGIRVYSGRTRFAWAELLWKCGSREDPGEVTRLLDDARRIAKDIGSVRLLKKVAELEKQVVSAPHGMGILQASFNEHELSRREREVLTLIVSGHADKEIAELLFISPRTVSTHVTHILNKLGVRSRLEAAQVVSSNGRYPGT